ncbi:hypothetical protein [Autumnicola tepida]
MAELLKYSRKEIIGKDISYFMNHKSGPGSILSGILNAYC